MHALTTERTYRRLDLSGVIHRRRLATLLHVFRRLDLPYSGSLAEFGSSNGFILQTLQREVFDGCRWSFTGFDFDPELLAGGEEKELPRTRFVQFDLNAPHPEQPAEFDVVLSVETLEHVGNYINGVRNIYAACKPGGIIVIGVPNERGIQGLLKYLGRMAYRGPNTYLDFFGDPFHRREYLMALLRDERIDRFRQPPRPLWHAHLGFDTRIFEQFLRTELAPPKAELLLRHTTGLGFNWFWAFRKNPT